MGTYNCFLFLEKVYVRLKENGCRISFKMVYERNYLNAYMNSDIPLETAVMISFALDYSTYEERKPRITK